MLDEAGVLIERAREELAAREQQASGKDEGKSS